MINRRWQQGLLWTWTLNRVFTESRATAVWAKGRSHPTESTFQLKKKKRRKKIASRAWMSKLPGNAGVSVLGDKSLEFYRDPVSFCRQRIEKHRSRVFQYRLLNRPTALICSVQGMRELLCGMLCVHAGVCVSVCVCVCVCVCTPQVSTSVSELRSKHVFCSQREEKQKVIHIKIMIYIPTI